MRPTLRQLEYIIAVAETGRIGAAARQLNVSQPSLSAQLAEVEADLGVTLFHRGRRGAQLTIAGDEVVRRARTVLRELQDLRASVQGDGGFQGRLRLGVLPSVGPYLLPAVVRRLHKEQPGLRLVVREENTRDLDEGLRSGRLDLIISTPEDHPGAGVTDLVEEHLWAAVAADHRLAQTPGPVRLSDLAGETFLTLGARHRLAHIVAALAAKAGSRVSDEYEGTSLDAVRLMAATGAGVAILPQIYAATEARRGTDVSLHRIDHPDARRTLSLIEPHSASPRPGRDVLADILLAEAGTIIRANL